MCNLTIANAALVNTNTGLTNKLNQALAQNANMQTEIESLKQKKGGGTRTTATPNYYCWSHRCTSNQNHTSLNCQNKKHGHKDWAILEK